MFIQWVNRFYNSKRKVRTAGLLLSLVFLAACLPKPVESPTPARRTPSLLEPGASASPTPTRVIQEIGYSHLATSPTPLFELHPEQPAEVMVTPTQAPSPPPDPLRFVFPTPGPAPVSAWRPPLYPVPWAPSPFDHFYFVRPIAADQVNWPIWDYRYGGTFLPEVVHTGIDIPVPNNTPVLAAGSGRVTWAGHGLFRGSIDDTSDPYGIAVVIQHDFGYEGETLHTVYGHLNRAEVVRGQYVEAGDLIGLTGETGQTSGPHLHFEVRIGKNSYYTSRNPELWLVPPQGWGVLVGRVTTSTGQLVPGQKVVVRSKSTGQRFIAQSYQLEAVNSDPYYRENLVVGDLPAGMYTLTIQYVGSDFQLDVEVIPGRVSYFNFRGLNGFSTELPPAIGSDFNPLLSETPPAP